MKKTGLRPRPSLTLLWLTCVLTASGCAMGGQAVKPSVCPRPSPAPANVMRPPSAEKNLRELLFEPAATPTTSSAPAKLSSPQTEPR